MHALIATNPGNLVSPNRTQWSGRSGQWQSNSQARQEKGTYRLPMNVYRNLKSIILLLIVTQKVKIMKKNCADLLNINLPTFIISKHHFTIMVKISFKHLI